jgi:glycosyltransferase involved in cell wall biosynthesis
MISIVIPVYNEVENIEDLCDRIRGARIKEQYEILIVDDGSTDGTFEKLMKIRKRDKRVRIVKHRKNFGQTAAFNSGFLTAKGDIIVTMDGDLQNDPNDINLVVEKMKEGYDVVSGRRKGRNDPIGKKFFSKISNFTARKLTGVQLHDFGCSLKAYRKEALKGIEMFGEMHRFIPALTSMNGYDKILEVDVSHHPRTKGKTKYGWGRLMKGLLDVAFIKFWSGYSTRPLHFFGKLAIYVFFLGFIIGLFKFLEFLLYGVSLTVGPLLLLSVFLMLAAVQFALFGFLGEINTRLYYKGGSPDRIESVY